MLAACWVLAAAGARGIDGLSGYILLMYIQRSVRKRIRHNSCQSVISGKPWGNLMSYAIRVTQWEQAQSVPISHQWQAVASSGKQEQPDELCNQGHSVGIRHNPCLQSFISGKQGQAQG